MQYKINLHAHTFFSDGKNSPLRLAMEAKSLGFTCLVITDHYYGPRMSDYSLTIEKMKLLKRSTKEAKMLLPVIVGMELAICGEEVLVFGSEMINFILEWVNNGKIINLDVILECKKTMYSAFVLCHPGDPKNWIKLRPLLDGYEQFNSGQNWFKNRDVDTLNVLPRWCNSDAHHVEELEVAYNIVDTKIETESQLIKYIRSGKQPEHYIKQR